MGRVFIFLFLLVVLGLSLAQSASPGDGSIQGNAYTNFFFGLRFEFSPSWIPQAEAARQQLLESGWAKLLHGLNQPAAKSSQTLLMLSRTLPGGSGGEPNRAIIMLVAEDMSPDPEVKSGKEWVLKLAETAKRARYAPVGDPTELQIGGKIFFRQDLKGKSSSGEPVYQSAVFTTLRGYALGFLVVAPNQQMLKNSLASLGNVVFF
jgi:hypothetical protein